jgi:hypothetical protein
MGSEHDVRGTRRDVELHEAARREVLRRDGQRALGENLERADALIKAAFELREAFSGARDSCPR